SSLPSRPNALITDSTSRSLHFLLCASAQMAACFTPRSRSRPLRFRLFSLALSLPRTLHISSGALSRSNTASLVQETLSSQLDIRSPFLLDQSLLKVPVFERMIQVANTGHTPWLERMSYHTFFTFSSQARISGS